ncbi:MAG: FprA family A-type flavoprotein [Kiritimatiellae bacterium]|nr:FprA family A-type flavoprotein [Kiritimatiellia bacterium]
MNDIKYIGCNDHDIDLFEGQYTVPNGMAYNSYAVLDDKITVFDTMDANFVDEWLGNLKAATGGRAADYLVVQHMEPDHSAGIARFAAEYPNATIVASAQAFALMKQFYGSDFAERRLVVKEGDTLKTGRHEFHFVAAPMVHWPEVIVTYDAASKVLFSADGFGKFGALDADEDWDCEARRYYIGIVGKFGAQVQALLKKAAALDIAAIYPLHGPQLTENLGHYLDLYNTWSSYAVETEGVQVCYTSVYGHTREAALKVAKALEARGVKVEVADLARDDMAEAVEGAFRYRTLVLATTTYNGLDIFPFMRTYVEHLLERNYQNRRVAIIENGSWAPQAAKVIKGLFGCSKNLEFVDPVVTVKSALDDTSSAALDRLVQAIAG